VLEGLIRNEVVKQFVRDNGFRVEDERVMQGIRRQDVFQVGGEFSYDSYVMLLSNQGISPEGYEREQRAQMEIEQLENGIVASAFFTPMEYRRYIELLAEERTAAFLRLDPATMASGVEVTDEQLQSFYDANNDLFMSDESVRLEYVEVLLDDAMQQVEVTEQDVLDYYELNPQRFIADDQRKISHILILVDDGVDEVAAVTTAESLKARLDQGEAFEALAREYSEDPVSAPEGGDLGWALQGDYPEAFEEALFALETGQVSDPVRTEFGIHLIRLDDLRAGERKTFDDVRAELFDELRMQQATDNFYELAEQVDDLALENPGNLSAVASETGLPLRTIETFTRSGGAPLGYSPELVDAAFSVALLEDGENSPLIELADERAVVISVAEYRPSVLMQFAEVREFVEQTLRNQNGSELAQNRGEEMLAQLEAGATFADVAAELAIAAPEPAVLTRASPEVPSEILAQIYRVPHPAPGTQSYHGFGLRDGGYAIVRLDAVTPGKPEDIPQQQRDQRKQMLAQQEGGAAAAALIADLRAAAKVRIAPDLFDQPEPL
ncbi:MAG: peptidyl-prolyl cis-trans isomerase, partial [Gammaproteobacteria bacterium]|nr:peptidyl-prolyl cis-trans isomerase [Gammaproteobacteria bacterium]